MNITPRNMRQRLRNPSMPMALGMIVVVLAIAGGILGPTVIKGGVEHYTELKRTQQREFAQPPGAWIRPWLVNKAEIMIAAEQPFQWHPADFIFGPCAANNTRQLPNKEFREAIQFSCGALSSIQLDHAGECAETNKCNVSEKAKTEIRAVIAVLDKAFDNAGFVGPVTQEQPS